MRIGVEMELKCGGDGEEEETEEGELKSQVPQGHE